MIKLLVVLASSILAGVLYRLGGWKETKIRDLGCPTIAVALLSYLSGWYWVYLLCFGLYFGSLTTYWKRGADVKWYHWLFTGLGYSLAFIPFAYVSGNWLGFCIRTIVLPLATMVWSETISNDIAEEFGRGFLSTITLPLLLI